MKFQKMKQLFDRDGILNIQAYSFAGATDVNIIRDINLRDDVSSVGQLNLFISATFAHNLHLVKYLWDYVESDLRDICTSITPKLEQFVQNFFAFADREMCEKFIDITGVDLHNAIYSSKLEVVQLAPFETIQQNSQFLNLNIGLSADLELLDYVFDHLSPTDDNIRVMFDIGCGTAAGGNATILRVIVTLVRQITSPYIQDIMQFFIECAYRFNNYHCIAVLAPYRLEYNLKLPGSMQLGDNISYLTIPPSVPIPAYYVAWFESFTTDNV
jgi:hypothetical protein